ncbi:MAG: hypothetical protein KGQ61_05185 [Planctomycetes bacterium]|nr:hypothetical protein [Planctomycetota bacterium]
MPWITLLDLLATVVLVAWLVHASQLRSALVSRRPRASAPWCLWAGVPRGEIGDREIRGG